MNRFWHREVLGHTYETRSYFPRQWGTGWVITECGCGKHWVKQVKA